MPASSNEQEVVDLLQHLIRNRCVNDGTRESGHESRSADVLESYLAGSGVELERHEPTPGRASLIARVRGSDPGQPTLLLMGHTDVVPANPGRWQRDPFGGELVDGCVWGRGAVDMLCQTASMAVALKRFAARGGRARGTLAYLAVADEEAGGNFGAGWLAEHAPEAIKADYVLTETGGMALPFPSTSGPKAPVMVGEKGLHWFNLRARGVPGHGSMPRRTGNALVKAADLIRHIADYRPETHLTDIWMRFIRESGLPAQMSSMLESPTTVEAFLDSAGDDGLAAMIRACTHTTFAPTVPHGGAKTNVIPDTADLEIDVRSLPGQTSEDVRRQLDRALGDLADEVEISTLTSTEASESSMETPLWEAVARATSALVPGTTILPFLLVGTSDARYFRRMGAVAYGAGLFSPRTSFADLARMIHGDDERIDIESLRLMTEFWDAVAVDLLAS